jgi:hypothetical protein
LFRVTGTKGTFLTKPHRKKLRGVKFGDLGGQKVELPAEASTSWPALISKFSMKISVVCFLFLILIFQIWIVVTLY